ncbi:MAG: NAD-dependent protein deacylase [Butyrivibrio sp.]|uniref:NAD-dependent protein deacylase n=1 Tax=Butyrivibrio sp. TaxID=28121 RepID=UPI001B6D82D3|nr:NAD-dependent protein deacylase [Butyrivibrio sp.]MBP3274515.1 NAD-dependent protein deacylase [Butyrivibrio sp.]MBP3783092.1 NAD-dependent protein deacylase [Butyrivibrio sp.]MBP3825698.1 NAD-dependent protein deacylase [Butyrivibrio sp.]
MSDVERLKELIDASDNVVFFGGAGVSTESGIPDFRSKDGLYNQHDVRFDMYQPEYLLSHSCLVYEPKVYYEFHRQKMDTRNIEPNNAHKYLARLEEMGKLKAIVTQNIDGLHQKAGSKVVYEIHGSALRNYCMSCGKEFPSDYIFESKEPIPRCSCGGVVRPDITLYEEGLPEDQVSGAIDSIARADMLIIGGTSLTVYPAASFVNYFRGKNLVIINRDRIDVRQAENTLVINRKIGELFAGLAQLQGIEL